MANITTFYPGGSIQHPVPVSERVDDQGSAAEIFFWSGTQAEYDAMSVSVTYVSGDNTTSLVFSGTDLTTPFSEGNIVYLREGNNTYSGTVAAGLTATSITITFTANTDIDTAGTFTLDTYNPRTIYYTT